MALFKIFSGTEVCEPLDVVTNPLKTDGVVVGSCKAIGAAPEIKFKVFGVFAENLSMLFGSYGENKGGP